MNTTSAQPAPRDVHVLRNLDAARTLLDPERRALLDALRKHPDSATGLARRLDDTRQRLNYHLRALEEAGAVELHEERRKGNCTERIMRVSARRFVLDPTALDQPDDVLPAEDRFSATYLVALASRTIRELADLQERAADEGKRLATASLDAEVELSSPDAMRGFIEDLTEAVGDVVARHHRPGCGGRRFRVVAGAHPPGPDAD